MERTVKTLPILPFPYVVFPGELMTLKIKEQHFVDMLRNWPTFGTLWVDDSKGSRIGCEVSTQQLWESDGEYPMEVVVRGGARFKILELDRSGAYPVAETTGYFDESPIDLSLSNRAITVYMKLIELAKETTVTPTFPPGEPISFILGRGVGLSLLQRQTILELRSEGERLNTLIGYCQKSIGRLIEAGRGQGTEQDPDPGEMH